MAWGGGVRCEPCGHAWRAVDRAMPLDEAARRLAALKCPACGGGADGILAIDGDAPSGAPKAGRGAKPPSAGPAP